MSDKGFNSLKVSASSSPLPIPYLNLTDPNFDFVRSSNLRYSSNKKHFSNKFKTSGLKIDSSQYFHWVQIAGNGRIPN